MNNIGRAIRTIEYIDDLNSRDQWMNRLHPLVKLLFVIFYIAFTMATDKYDVIRAVLLGAVPLVLFVLADLSIVEALRRLKVVLPIILLVGAVNVFLDKELFMLGEIAVRAGVISMLTLFLKGVYAVLMAYIFVACTSIDALCTALKKLHVPIILITVIMLTYRYIAVLLNESERVVTAYSLRAPGQKGIHFKVWGSLAGLMLLRSFDRAEEIYQSMKLRGYE